MEEFTDHKMSDGKYNGELITFIHENDPDYLKWWYENANPAMYRDYNGIINNIAELLGDPKYPKKLAIVTKPLGYRYSSNPTKKTLKRVRKKYGK